MRNIKEGEVLEFTQKNGNRLVILIHEDCVLVKADNLGTDLKIERKNSFCVGVIAINKD
jgi:hypothetical protein